jgi:hypothetical protein
MQGNQLYNFLRITFAGRFCRNRLLAHETTSFMAATEYVATLIRMSAAANTPGYAREVCHLRCARCSSGVAQRPRLVMQGGLRLSRLEFRHSPDAPCCLFSPLRIGNSAQRALQIIMALLSPCGGGTARDDPLSRAGPRANGPGRTSTWKLCLYDTKSSVNIR